MASVVTLISVFGVLACVLMIVGLQSSKPDLTLANQHVRWCYDRGMNLAYSPYDIMVLETDRERALAEAPWFVHAYEGGDVCCVRDVGGGMLVRECVPFEYDSPLLFYEGVVV